jgi:recombinational DNA repair ATPase RecF
MITRIEVNNFKSLTDFSLNFSPGLNVLVGPNGSGKTNIVSVFEYLAHLMETDSSDATSRAGGAGAVFIRIGQGYEKRISARLIGCVLIRNEIGRAKGAQENPSKPPYYLYEYSMSLLFPDTLDSVVFESQRFRLKRVTEFIIA